MKSWKKPTAELIDKALDSFKREHHRNYFFRRLKNPLWLQPLVERGCFQAPPSVRRSNAYIQFPYWGEIQYLRNVARYVPNEVINLVLGLPKVDNPYVYDGILDIALQLHGEQSAKLKPKILEYVGLESQFLMHRCAYLLVHWTAEKQIPAALELSKALLVLGADLQSAERQRCPRERPEWETLPDPFQPMDTLVYRDLLIKGIQPLAEKAPYQIVCLFTETITDLIRLQTHQKDFDKMGNGSELWGQQLHKFNTGYQEPMKVLVQILTFACEKVFEKSPDSVADLDKVLQKQHWKMFKHLRDHLYAQYPNRVFHI